MNIKYISIILGCVVISGCMGTTTTKDEFKIPVQQEEVDLTPRSTNPMISDGSINLFQDNTSFEVGDIITVILDEKTNAKKNAKSSAKKSSKASIDNPILLGLRPKIGSLLNKYGEPDLSIGFGGDTGWTGDGSSSQSNSLAGEISVFVIGKMKNGNLKIRGAKKVLINQGAETIVLSGIVRAVDISSDNTVLSTKIAMADIQYFGNGNVADSNRMGWLSKFFNKGVWFW